ncbi:unnamed protein product [Tilletia controversa]|nr:unnamed protein product [Tilletia controversa]CAD6973156.1 unnamed protein product [Tilletia controversa]CAD6983928.1 unnamed protein product [Tilletia controversa]
MIRTSARQKLLSDARQALSDSINAYAGYAGDLDDYDDASSASTSGDDIDMDEALDSDLSMDSMSSLDDDLSSCFDDDLSSLGSRSSSDGHNSSDTSDSDDSDADLSRHIRLAAEFYQSLTSPRTLFSQRDKRQTPKIHLQLEQLRESGLPSDLKSFRRLVRVNPEAFENLVRVLSPHPVFANKHPRRSQAPIAEQLAVTLYWLGRSGNGAGSEDVALACGCAEGLVHAYGERVILALYDARSVALCWVSEDEKAAARQWVVDRSGFEEWARRWCMTDGSQIPLAFQPSTEAHPREYWDRKHQYALNLQATVLPTSLRIIDFVAGYKGSAQDSRAFAASDIVQHPLRYLDNGDFVWVDGG